MPSPHTALPPEHCLLLAVLRNDTEAVTRRGGDDRAWSALLPLARTQRIAPLAAHHVVRLAESGAEVPADALAAARDLLRKAARASFVLMQRLERYLTALDGAGIRAAVLKGAALARTAYPSTELRLFSDYDVLVARSDIDRALEVLAAQGLRPHLGPEHEAHYANWHFHHILSDGETVIFELHWGLVRPHSPYRLDGEGVLTRARRESEGGPLDASHEDQLLHAAAQALAEGFSGLLRVCDVRAVVTRDAEALDWEGLARRGREGRLGPTLDTLLRLADRLLGLPRPAGAELLRTPASVFVGLEPLEPGRLMLLGFPGRARRVPQLFRFWLLPGARGTVVRQLLFGQPRDRDREALLVGPRGPTQRAGRFLRRAAVLLGLVGRQLLAFARGRRDHVSLSSR